MSTKLKNEFIYTVTKQVRFPFDRKSIALELEDHLKELESYYFESCQDLEKARKIAIQEMGDPRIIGKELNRVHKPIWGWVWLFSKSTCIILICVVMWMSFQKVWDTFQSSRYYGPQYLADEFYLSSLGDNPNEVKFVASYQSVGEIWINKDLLSFDEIKLYSDGTLVILYQDIKPFDLFGRGSDDYPIQQLSTIILSDGTLLSFRQDWSDTLTSLWYKGHVLVANNVPLDAKSFKLNYVGYSEEFQLEIQLRKEYEKE